MATRQGPLRVESRRGYHATKIEDIAGEAGIAKGTVYLYFGSREEILVAAFEVFAGAMMAGAFPPTPRTRANAGSIALGRASGSTSGSL